jgi:hypothetical protein
MPGQGSGPAVLARQGPQSGQHRRPDGDKVRAGLLPGIGRRSTQVCDQLIQRTLRGFAALPQLQEADERGIIGRQHRGVQPGLVLIGGVSPPAVSGEATRQQRRGQEQKRGSIAHRRRLLAQCQRVAPWLKCQQRRFFLPLFHAHGGCRQRGFLQRFPVLIKFEVPRSVHDDQGVSVR